MQLKERSFSFFRRLKNDFYFASPLSKFGLVFVLVTTVVVFFVFEPEKENQFPRAWAISPYLATMYGVWKSRNAPPRRRVMLYGSFVLCLGGWVLVIESLFSQSKVTGLVGVFVPFWEWHLVAVLGFIQWRLSRKSNHESS